MTNRLELSGVVTKPPIQRLSPAGVAHCHFTLEHRSIMQEANLPRQVYCRIQVVLSGEVSKHYSEQLVAGSTINVSGFIAYQQTQNGLGKLVLHADKIIHN